MLYEDAQSESGFAIGRDGIDKFTSGRAVVRDAIHLIKAILINVAVCRGITFYAANCIGTRHARIIEGARRKVNRGAQCSKWKSRAGKDLITELLRRSGTLRVLCDKIARSPAAQEQVSVEA